MEILWDRTGCLDTWMLGRARISGARKCDSDVAFVLDPIIATASTIMSVISILKKVGLLFGVIFF